MKLINIILIIMLTIGVGQAATALGGEFKADGYRVIFPEVTGFTSFFAPEVNVTANFTRYMSEFLFKEDYLAFIASTRTEPSTFTEIGNYRNYTIYEVPNGGVFAKRTVSENLSVGVITTRGDVNSLIESIAILKYK